MLYSTLKNSVVGPVLNRVYRHEVRGLEHLPASGAIIASNHRAFCDSVFLALALPRPIFFLAKSDYFTGRGLTGWARRWFFEAVGQLPMDRSGGEKSLKSLEAGVEKLRQGGLLGIYPEGTRAPDSRGYKAKIGVARLALTARVPVVPVGQVGTEKVQPIGSNAVRVRENGTKITVQTVFGEPLDFSAYYDRADDFEVLRRVADEIGAAVRQLAGQDYVPVYAGDVKKVMDERSVSVDRAIELVQPAE